MSNFNLSESKCDEVFKNILRSSPANAKHMEHKLLPFSQKINVKFEQKTDIFNPEYKPDYTINRKKFYDSKTNMSIYENSDTSDNRKSFKKMKTDIDKQYPHKEEKIKASNLTIDRQRRIKDTYTSNSMPEFDADESVKYNQMTRNQISAKVNRINSLFTSESFKDSVFNQNDNIDYFSDKITNQHLTIDSSPKRYVKSFKTISSNGKTCYQ